MRPIPTKKEDCDMTDEPFVTSYSTYEATPEVASVTPQRAMSPSTL